MKKTFESLTKKMTFFFLGVCVWEWIKRGIEEKDKELLKKNQNWFYMFLKIENRLIERNQARIEMYMKKGSTGWKESKRPETLCWKPDFLLHILIGQKIESISWILKKQKFWKILENFFWRTIWKTGCMIWHVCSWLQMIFKTKLF